MVMGNQPIGPVTPGNQILEDSKIKELVGNCEQEVILNTSKITNNDDREKESTSMYARTSNGKDINGIKGNKNKTVAYKECPRTYADIVKSDENNHQR